VVRRLALLLRLSAAAMEGPMIAVVERTENSKLTDDANVSATYAPQSTCPKSCPLRDAGCYAELGNMGFQTARLNRAAAGSRRKPAAKPIELARLEAAHIALLSGRRKLRVHVVGDCASASTAAIIGAAMVKHENRRGKAAWTYTHAWKTVPAAAWQGARVLASCHSARDVHAAAARGYAAAILTPPHPTHKVYQYQGLSIVPCPAQFRRADGRRHSTCEQCSLCQSPEMLKARGLVIGFQPDSNTKARILRVIQPESHQ
jgi:hypothetical protein